MSSFTVDDFLKVDTYLSTSREEHSGVRQRIMRHLHHDTTSRDILLFLIAFRILNALSIRTFFQPDEYFQSLEPAWQIAFGTDGGAWITWEWKHYLRSAIHPYLFAALYKLSAAISTALSLSPAYNAELLIASPKVLQAVITALGDCYTWKLGQKVYGSRSNEAWAALALTVCNPWQWFCSTRTLSNCLETTLTIIALYLWPWEMSSDATEVSADVSETSTDEKQLTTLRGSLLLAAVACVLRPTNVLIWACLACFAFLRGATRERLVLIRETALCGSLILAISATLDRIYYGQWVFPPFRFLYFNIAKSLAVFYGRNDWHYYLSQGFPLLLTTSLPFALIDIYHATTSSASFPATALQSTIRHQLATLTLLVPFALSLVSHKEVRFIYPLLSPLHVLAAKSFTEFFLPAISPVSPTRRTPSSLLRRLLLFSLLGINIFIATLSTQYHQPAPLSVLSYLRSQYETHYLTQPPQSALIPQADTTMTIGFLMPCHSTPWRSHLVHPGIKAWALTCEPPIHLNNSAAARAAYRDEADRFYDNPTQFLKTHLGSPPRRKDILGSKTPQEGLGMGRIHETEGAWDGKEGTKVWPDYLVFFEQLEGTLKGYVGGRGGYVEGWRGWNSWGHDDWRRKGDVVVWCLRGEGESGKKKRIREMEAK
ncbi:glycosylphosphatidylinositol anchor biosynthesis [Trapelia coarctata]|nr:glycosylphosphatidylinositol anchor biosynthesis [Trapelia coarctata]